MPSRTPAKPPLKPAPVPVERLPRRIVITGFMGAGKTTVGKLLADRLGWRFIDADDRIEAQAGTTIAEIFRTQGETWFRELEHQVIRQHVIHPNSSPESLPENLVLSLGGGAIEDQRTRELLLSTPGSLLIHLEASLQTILTRCAGTQDIRPVLADRVNLDARYQKRLPLYRQSHLSLPVDNLDPEAVVESILKSIAVEPS